MKEIKAVIRPNKLAALRDALVALPGFPGMTVTKVEGCSAPSRHVPAKVKIKDENRYWQVTTGSEAEPGINGGLVFRRGPPPAEGQSVNSFICTIEVPDLDEHIDRVIRAGGRVAVPKMPIMGVGWLAYCLDSEKNIFGMMQTDEMAQ